MFHVGSCLICVSLTKILPTDILAQAQAWKNKTNSLPHLVNALLPVFTGYQPYSADLK